MVEVTHFYRTGTLDTSAALLKAVLWNQIRIQIQGGPWIQIRIRIRDPDQEDKNDPEK